ncbi:GDSL esterase/lipase [Pyrus ussuriensis x Pyrus communis]|uniref:GDSL esterase/lipase n=1 Tax=Pyrus ussuriensis x Pyrus communis TaxID=2448454 RepID=A0A5N5FZC8_9ROSA|nr:GDSL esterase/lipase [Pyrus ussuriensis x Pyrus communis]
MCLFNQGPLQPLPNKYSPIWRNFHHDSWNKIEAPNQAFAPPSQQEFFDTTLEDTLRLLAQNNLQFQQSTSSIIQNHSLALTKPEIQVGQIVQAINEHQSGAFYAYFHSVVHTFYKDEEPYTLPKPYVPLIPFPGIFVKQKHDEPPIDVLEEIVPNIVFEALRQSSNSIEWFSKSMSDSACCFTSFQVPDLESLEDDLLPFQDEKRIEEEDMVLHFIRKERQKRRYNQVLKEIQRTIFKVPRKKSLLPTKV